MQLLYVRTPVNKTILEQVDWHYSWPDSGTQGDNSSPLLGAASKIVPSGIFLCTRPFRDLIPAHTHPRTQ